MDKSETIREWIRSLFEENFDFSNRDLTKEKFRTHFESEENKPLEITWSKHQTLFIKNLKQVCKEKKIDIRTYGYAREKIKFEIGSSEDAEIKISPKPKGTKGELVAKTGTELTETKTEGETKITPISEDEAIKLTKIIWRVGGRVLHAWKEGFALFDDDELDELAVAWYPLCKPYLEKYGGRIAVALLVTSGVFSNKGRPEAFKMKKKNKDDDDKEPEEQSTNETDKEEFEKWKANQGKK